MWSAQSESHQESHDTTPRTYICFCQKKFTTYPGIYLHMKSKHSNLFMKYKKLKITKLFRKSYDDKGTEVHRLEKIDEHETAANQSLERIYRENRTAEIENQAQLGLRLVNERDAKNGSRTIQPAATRKIKDQPSPHLPVRFHHQMQRGPMGALGAQNLPFPIPGDNFPFGMPPPNPHMPHMSFPYPPPASFFPQLRPSFKKMLQRFLFESTYMDKSAIRRALYGLMVFVDNNFESLNDPRAKDRIFLSYSDQFDHSFVNPLIQEHISHLRAAKDRTEDKSSLEREIDCLLRLASWISNFPTMNLPMRMPSMFPTDMNSIPDNLMEMIERHKNQIEKGKNPQDNSSK